MTRVVRLFTTPLPALVLLAGLIDAAAVAPSAAGVNSGYLASATCPAPSSSVSIGRSPVVANGRAARWGALFRSVHCSVGGARNDGHTAENISVSHV